MLLLETGNAPIVEFPKMNKKLIKEVRLKYNEKYSCTAYISISGIDNQIHVSSKHIKPTNKLFKVMARDSIALLNKELESHPNGLQLYVNFKEFAFVPIRARNFNLTDESAFCIEKATITDDNILILE